MSVWFTDSTSFWFTVSSSVLFTVTMFDTLSIALVSHGSDSSSVFGELMSQFVAIWFKVFATFVELHSSATSSFSADITPVGYKN